MNLLFKCLPICLLVLFHLSGFQTSKYVKRGKKSITHVSKEMIYIQSSHSKWEMVRFVYKGKKNEKKG